MVRLAALLLIPGLLLAAPAGTAAARHTAAECRAACAAAGVQASCDWLTPVPRRCLRTAIAACRRDTAAPAAHCPPPADLPGCLDHHGCPFGALCTDAVCQVRPCGGATGAGCGPGQTCAGDRCVVAECAAVTANCPRGFHCAPAPPPLGSVSGTCAADAPGLTYCSVDTDCIAAGRPNPACVQGVCTGRGRPLGRCTVDADCTRHCRRGHGAGRLPRCTAGGACVCPGCVADADCAALLACPAGRVARCLGSGTCACRKTRPTTSTTVTTTTSTTVTTAPSTTTTTVPVDTTCCCTFDVGDLTWHCVHASQPSPALCAVPWPECCSQDYTVCD